VLFGVDEGMLARALAADLFEPHRSAELVHVDPAYDLPAFGDHVTPVDAGFVTFNLDRAWFEADGRRSRRRSTTSPIPPTPASRW
jgi:thiamine transport system substrate-binding protein